MEKIIWKNIKVKKLKIINKDFTFEVNGIKKNHYKKNEKILNKEYSKFHKNSKLIINKLNTIYNNKLDYTYDSLDVLEQVINDLKKDYEEKNISENITINFAIILGIYLGDVLLKNDLSKYKGKSWIVNYENSEMILAKKEGKYMFPYWCYVILPNSYVITEPIRVIGKKLGLRYYLCCQYLVETDLKKFYDNCKYIELNSSMNEDEINNYLNDYFSLLVDEAKKLNIKLDYTKKSIEKFKDIIDLSKMEKHQLISCLVAYFDKVLKDDLINNYEYDEDLVKTSKRNKYISLMFVNQYEPDDYFTSGVNNVFEKYYDDRTYKVNFIEYYDEMIESATYKD